MFVEKFKEMKDLEDSGLGSSKEFSRGKRAIIFDLALARYGFLLKDINTVFTPDIINPLPNTPDFILGLTNYRNDVLPVIDLRKKLYSLKPAYSPFNRLAKVRFQDMSLAIFLERIVESVQYGTQDIVDHGDQKENDVPPDWILESIRFQKQKVSILNLQVVLGSLYDEVHHQSTGR